MRALGIVRLKYLISFSPFNELLITPISDVNVVVFNPPPVPEGDAPIIISNVIKKSENSDKAEMGTVLNPAVVKAVML